MPPIADDIGTNDVDDTEDQHGNEEDRDEDENQGDEEVHERVSVAAGRVRGASEPVTSTPVVARSSSSTCLTIAG